MITVKDFQKATEFPRACKDDTGRLRVGAAVGTTPDTLERVAALRAAGVDLVVVDTAHGHSKGRHRHRQAHQGAVAGCPGDRRQHRHAGGCARAGRRWRGRGQGRHRPGLDLHHPHRRRRSACRRFLPSPTWPQSLRDTDVPVISDGGIRFSGRHRQGDRRRRARGDDRRTVRRHRGVSGRGRAVPGRLLQVLPRHGFARGHGRAPRLRRPLLPGRGDRAGEARARGCRGARALQGQRRHHPAPARRRSARGDGLHRQPQHHRPAHASRCSCASPTPGCARATCTTSASPRKRPTTGCPRSPHPWRAFPDLSPRRSRGGRALRTSTRTASSSSTSVRNTPSSSPGACASWGRTARSIPGT